MIVRYMHDDRTLADREVFVNDTGLPEITIRVVLRKLGVFRYDVKTGRALYDYKEAMERLAAVKPNPKARGPRRKKVPEAA